MISVTLATAMLTSSAPDVLSSGATVYARPRRSRRPDNCVAHRKRATEASCEARARDRRTGERDPRPGPNLRATREVPREWRPFPTERQKCRLVRGLQTLEPLRSKRTVPSGNCRVSHAARLRSGTAIAPAPAHHARCAAPCPEAAGPLAAAPATGDAPATGEASASGSLRRLLKLETERLRMRQGLGLGGTEIAAGARRPDGPRGAARLPGRRAGRGPARRSASSPTARWWRSEATDAASSARSRTWTCCSCTAGPPPRPWPPSSRRRS